MRIVRRTRCRSKRGWSKACSAPSAAGRRAHGSVILAKARHTPPATDDVSLAPHVAALTPSAGELRARSPGATRRRSTARAKLLRRDVACVRRGAVSRQSRDPSGAPGGRPLAADPPADGRVLGWMGDDPSEPVFWRAPNRNRPRSRRSAPAPKTIRRSNSGTATRALIRMALGTGPRGKQTSGRVPPTKRLLPRHAPASASYVSRPPHFNAAANDRRDRGRFCGRVDPAALTAAPGSIRRLCFRPNAEATRSLPPLSNLDSTPRQIRRCCFRIAERKRGRAPLQTALVGGWCHDSSTATHTPGRQHDASPASCGRPRRSRSRHVRSQSRPCDRASPRPRRLTSCSSDMLLLAPV